MNETEIAGDFCFGCGKSLGIIGAIGEIKLAEGVDMLDGRILCEKCYRDYRIEEGTVEQYDRCRALVETERREREALR